MRKLKKLKIKKKKAKLDLLTFFFFFLGALLPLVLLVPTSKVI